MSVLLCPLIIKIDFFISVYVGLKIVHNGKSIGEVRAKLDEKFNFDQS